LVNVLKEEEPLKKIIEASLFDKAFYSLIVLTMIATMLNNNQLVDSILNIVLLTFLLVSLVRWIFSIIEEYNKKGEIKGRIELLAVSFILLLMILLPLYFIITL
jgi:hypothetical protein